MDRVHRLYVTHLNRTCELEVTRRLSLAPITASLLAKLECEIKASDEASCVALQRKALKQWWGMESMVDHINDVYVNLVERLPSNEELAHAISLNNVTSLKTSLMQSSDYIYLQQCRSHLPRKSDVPTAVPDGAIGIKYCFPVGTSGIAKVSRDLIRSLMLIPDVFLELECVQFHNFSISVVDDALKGFEVKLDRYDYVVMQGLPEFIPVIAKRERRINPNVLIYAIVAWETDRLPFEWIPWLQYADKISCPSVFNTEAFKCHQTILPAIDVLHHPIVIPPPCSDAMRTCPIRRLKEKGVYVFYNISEWTNRKGITELVDAFALAFRDDPTTCLYLKTFGDVPEHEGKAYLRRIGVSNVLLDYTRVSDAYIDCLHECGDCFVSMTKAEGHFIGACRAHLAGKPLIVTGASGHIDYLNSDDPSCHLISVKPQAAKFCTPIASKHRACAIMPHCIHFTKFVSSQMQWFAPDADSAVDLMKNVRHNTTTTSKPTTNNFTLDKVGPRLLKSILSTHPFATRSLSLDKSMTASFLRAYTWTVEPPHFIDVLVINAGVYGNVGDHLYNHVLAAAAAQQKNHQLRLVHVSDNDVVLKDSIEACTHPRAFTAEMKHFDAVVFGGGGLLSLERLESNSNLLPYAAWCKRTGTPLYLISVGFQDVSLSEMGDLQNASIADRYKPVLETAQYVSVRSQLDYAICMRALDFKDVLKVHYHPDVVYSLLGVDAALFPRTSVRDTVVIIFSESSTRFLETPFPPPPHGGKRVFANFAGNAGYPEQRAQLDVIEAAVMKMYPDSVFYHGLDVKSNDSPGASLFTIGQMVALLQRSSYVYTKRHHGYILAQVCGVPHIVLGDVRNYKTAAALHDTGDIDLASTVAHARAGLFRPLDMIADGVHMDYRAWTNDQRNATIVRMAKRTGHCIGMIQTLTNRCLQLSEMQVTPPSFVRESGLRRCLTRSS